MAPKLNNANRIIIKKAPEGSKRLFYFAKQSYPSGVTPPQLRGNTEKMKQFLHVDNRRQGPGFSIYDKCHIFHEAIIIRTAINANQAPHVCIPGKQCMSTVARIALFR